MVDGGTGRTGGENFSIGTREGMFGSLRSVPTIGQPPGSRHGVKPDPGIELPGVVAALVPPKR
jgi:hypothetical protein